MPEEPQKSAWNKPGWLQFTAIDHGIVPHRVPHPLVRRLDQIFGWAAAEALEGEEVETPPEYAALAVLDDFPGIDQRRLAVLMGLDRTNVGHLIDRLETKGLVNRNVSGTDRRARELRLTAHYVTLEDLAAMVKNGEDFIVHDAKSGEDITRSVLTQIIFEQENKQGQNLLPITFLRQLIRFYGDSMQMLVPRYLEVSIDSLTREQEKFRQQMAQALGVGAFTSLEEQVRRNMDMFERAFAMFAPFARREAQSGDPTEPEKPSAGKSGGIEDLKRQLDEMQKKVDRLSEKDKGG